MNNRTQVNAKMFTSAMNAFAENGAGIKKKILPDKSRTRKSPGHFM